MTVFFTKTCARDWERCCYQMLAIRRLFPLARHIVLTECAEATAFKKLEFSSEMERQLDLAIAVNGLTAVHSVESLMPEAMKIEDLYLRQQYCKLKAPVVLGEDTIQLDSDMCPKPVQTRWADELYVSWDSGPLSAHRVRWHAPIASKAMKPAVENWHRAFKALAPDGLDDVARPIEGGNRDFMRSQLGWKIPRCTARGFLRALGPDPIDRILDLVRYGYKFSEYQMLGLWAYSADRRGGIRFVDYADEDPWLLHFTSTEKLTDDQRAQLREAAGLEA